MIEPTEPLGVVSSAGAISAKYIVPPFSVLDTRMDYWRKRRRWWLGLGIQSELGRGEIEMPHGGLGGDGTDPVSSKLRDYSTARMKSSALDVSSLLASGGWNNHPAHPQMSRREADERSNLNGAPPLPEYAEFGTANVAPGTSIFDPVLAEMMVRWFCPRGGSVLDPFAGGSVRGIVSAVLGHQYTGVDLSEAQIHANYEQARTILSDAMPMPHWITGDSLDAVPMLAPATYDMLLTCPPYYDLEVYSDDPRDISTASTYEEFLWVYRQILAESCERLTDGRYAVVVVSEVRDRRGAYHGLVPDTVRALEDAGLRYYNEAILVNTAGTLPMRIEGQFSNSRKLGRMHQNVVIAVKGDPQKQWDASREDGALDPQLAFTWEGR